MKRLSPKASGLYPPFPHCTPIPAVLMAPSKDISLLPPPRLNQSTPENTSVTICSHVSFLDLAVPSLHLNHIHLERNPQNLALTWDCPAVVWGDPGPHLLLGADSQSFNLS